MVPPTRPALTDLQREQRRIRIATPRRTTSGTVRVFRLPRLVLPLTLLVAALSGCSDGSDDTGTTPVASVTPLASATTETSPTPDALARTDVDADAAYEHVRRLSVDIGSRLSGTDELVRARDYLRGELERYGYAVSTEAFPFGASGAALVATLRVAGAEVKALPFRNSAVSSAAGALFSAGLGVREAYPPEGIGGAVALVRRGELFFRDKIENAQAAGAAAVIIYNNEPGEFAGDAGEGATVPVVAISGESGERIAAQVERGAVSAEVDVRVPGTQSWNVVAMRPGAARCETVTGGHYDSVITAPGADDNASGTAGVLEVARLAAANDLPGDHCFVLFGAEEQGLFGSRAFVADLDDGEAASVRAMLNLDVIGTNARLSLIGDADLVELGRVQADTLGVEAEPDVTPNGAGSDHFSFQERGIPVLMFYRNDTFIHTPADAIDRIDRRSLADTIAVAYATLADIAG
jgi:hypothetical protein